MEKANWLRLRLATWTMIIGVASGACLAAGCANLADRNEGAVVPTPSASASAPGGEDTLEVGEAVQLTGTVIDDGGAFAFEVTPDGGGEPVPVISVEDFVIDKGDRVTVKGRLVTFDAAALERELGINLDDDWVRRTSGRKTLVATSVKAVTGLPSGPTSSASPH